MIAQNGENPTRVLSGELREMLNKAYDLMKRFVVDGRNLLKRFLESIGQAVEKVRDSFKR